MVVGFASRTRVCQGRPREGRDRDLGKCRELKELKKEGLSFRVLGGVHQIGFTGGASIWVM